MGFRTVESQLVTLKSYWEKIEATHEQLVAVCEKHEGAEELPYFKSDWFSTGMGLYYEARGCLLKLYDKKNPTQPTTPAVTATSIANSRHRFPAISLPTFSGNYSEWTQFRDLFSSIVGSLTDLPQVEKPHHLRSCLREEAYSVIANVDVRGNSYDNAWKLLTSQYEVNIESSEGCHDRPHCSGLTSRYLGPNDREHSH